MNKTKQIIIIVICSVIIILGGLTLATPEVFIKYISDDCYLYEETPDGIILTKYEGNSENILVPNMINGKKVISLRGTFYENTDIVHIKISEGIEQIDYMSFYCCSSLVKVTIPNSVKTIGHACFDRCVALESVELGEGITEIMPYAFEGCSFLKHITLPETTKFIGENAFKNCRRLEAINIPASVEIIGGVTQTEGKKASQIGSVKTTSFDGCKNLKITIDSNNPYYTVNAKGKIVKK